MRKERRVLKKKDEGREKSRVRKENVFYAGLTFFLQANAEMSCHDTTRSVSQFGTQSCLRKQTLSELVCFSVRHVGKRCHFSPPSSYPALQQHTSMEALPMFCVLLSALFTNEALVSLRHQSYSEGVLLISSGWATFHYCELWAHTKVCACLLQLSLSVSSSSQPISAGGYHRMGNSVAWMPVTLLSSFKVIKEENCLHGGDE